MPTITIVLDLCDSMATQKTLGAEMSEAETAEEDYANTLSDILDTESSASGYVVLFTHSI